MIKFCKKCQDNKINKYNPSGYYYGYKEDISICPICGNEFINIDFPALDLKIIQKISEDVSFIETMIQLRKDDIIEYETKMSQFRTQVKQQENIKQQSSSNNKLRCPTCGSTNIKKISGTKRWLSTGIFGLSSSNIGKTMQCNSCGYKW